VTKDRLSALLGAIEDGDAPLLDELVPVVYGELRRMARRFIAGEAQPLTLDTTALVHEAYLKLVGDQNLPARGRAVFFGAAARAMRQVLVDSARRRASLRRGGRRPLALTGLDPAAPEQGTDVLDVDRALERLAVQYPRQAQVVECRFFGGLSVEETAQALDLSSRTVKRDWSLAQAWLYRELQVRPSSGPGARHVEG
jgi:RNA polymerase sigma factor (TIGR02999 family)